MDVLIAGAGAVGQVYGHHLARGGARVSVLVRERHAEAARAGYLLHRLRRGRAPERGRFVPHQVLTDPKSASGFDQLWLCVPTDALTDDWLDDLARAESTIVHLSPGVH